MASNTFTERIKIMLQGARKAASDGKKVESSLKKIQKAAVMAGGSFFAAQGIIEGFKKSIELAGQFDNVSAAFSKLTQSVGGSAVSINKLRDAVDGTINDIELMTMANNALTLGVADSTDQLAEMFDGAQRLGKALGLDTKQAVDSLVVGMGRQSRMMLDNLGIIVDAEKAYAKYKEEMEIGTRALTDQEKKVAFNNEAIRQLTESVALLGDEQLTMADKINQTQSSWDRFTTEIGKGTEGLFSALADGIDKMKDWGLLLDDIADAQRLAPLATTFDESKNALVDFFYVVGQNHPELEKYIDQERLATMGAKDLVGFVKLTIGALEQQGIQTFDTRAALAIYTQSMIDNLGVQGQIIEGEKDWERVLENHITKQAQLTEEEKKYYKEKFAAEDALEKAERRRIDASIALGVTQDNVAEAAGQASAVYLADKVKEILAEYIFSAFKGKGFLGGLAAVATGAAFSSTLTQMFTKGKVAAEGMSEIVDEPTLILAGEAGPEYVDIDPLTNEGAGRGNGMSITFTGNVMSQDFIESEAIPMIKKAIRKGGDIGIG